MDSSDILQHDALHLRHDTHLIRFWKKLKFRDFMAVFHTFWVNTDLCIWTHDSEMLGWIHLIFYSMVQCILGMILIFSDFEKNWNLEILWQFFMFGVNIDLVHLSSELWDGLIDSSDILQHEGVYTKENFLLLSMWKKWKSLISCLLFRMLLPRINIGFVHMDA